MKLFKAQRLALVAILSTLTMGALSFLPGSVPFGSQIAGAQAVTTLTLSVNPNPAAFGAPVTFSADLENGTSPTGSISLAVYTDTACSDLAFTLGVDNNVDAGNGTYTIGTTTPLAPGNYYGDAYYASGDTSINDNAASGSCTGLILTVDPAVATTELTLSASPNPAALGTPVTFSATLSDGNAPTGSISLGAYSDSDCNTLAFTLGVDNNVDAGNGTYTIGTFTPLAAGTYYGDAYYTGDIANSSASSGDCLPILVVSPNHVHSCRTILNLGPDFLDLIYMAGPDSPFTLYLDSLAPCVIP
jgi:hypothetical protein